MLIIVGIVAIAAGIGFAWLKYGKRLEQSRDDLSRTLEADLIPWPRPTLGSWLYKSALLVAFAGFIIACGIIRATGYLDTASGFFVVISIICISCCVFWPKRS